MPLTNRFSDESTPIRRARETVNLMKNRVGQDRGIFSGYRFAKKPMATSACKVIEVGNRGYRENLDG